MMVAFRKDPPPDELRKKIYYEDGNLYWHKEFYSLNGRRSAKPIGTLYKTGYKHCKFMINGEMRSYLVHRLIYWLVKGVWCPVIDHKDRNRLNNHIDNLRESDNIKNIWNRTVSKRNKTGYLGVFKDDKTSKYRITISIDGKQYIINGFDTPEKAALSRDIIARLIYGDFASYNLLDIPSLSIT